MRIFQLKSSRMSRACRAGVVQKREQQSVVAAATAGVPVAAAHQPTHLLCVQARLLAHRLGVQSPQQHGGEQRSVTGCAGSWQRLAAGCHRRPACQCLYAVSVQDRQLVQCIPCKTNTTSDERRNTTHEW